MPVKWSTFASVIMFAGWFVAAIVAGEVNADESAASTEDATQLKLLSTEKIWDEARHNAFTDLIRFHDTWICAFREADGHNEPNSRMRILASPNAKQWSSVAALKDDRGDIRDAKLAIRPDGKLMLLTAVHLRDHPTQRHQSLVWLTDDLENWEGPFDVGEPDIWLWGITWHEGVGYSIGYSTGEKNGQPVRFVRLYHTRDGLTFEPLAEDLEVQSSYPNESSIVFDDEGTAYTLLRCSGPAQVGTSRPPYTQWHWQESELRLGGPALTRTPNGRLLGAGRLYGAEQRTSLLWVDADAGSITEALELPSGGNDTSYPGFVWQGDILYVSYYSSHEDKTSIYLARVQVGETE